MKMRTPIFLIRLVGLLLCAVSILLALNASGMSQSDNASVLLTVLLPHLSALIVNRVSLFTPALIGATFWYCTSFRGPDKRYRLTITLLAIQTLLALLVAPELQFIVAVEAGLLLSPWSGGIWVFTQAGLIWLSSALYPQLMSWVIPATKDAWQRVVSIGLFMLLAMLYNFFAFALGWLAATLERSIFELRAAQGAATLNARLNERLKIARELHDAVGHQLTALSVNLQVANYLSKDEARSHVEAAYQLTGELLTDVRAVVSEMREPTEADFADELRAFAIRLEEPRVHLSLEGLPRAVPAEFSHALLRCAQEIITNTVRHAKAKNLWIKTAAHGNEYELRARDDGRGNKVVIAGNGITGIIERVHELRGEVQFYTEPEGGFEVTIRLPLSMEGSR